jgi:hypothetical protein
LIEIGVACADPPNAVLAHENRRVRVMQQVTGNMRQLQNNLSGDVGMPVRRHKNSEAWRSEERGHKLPRRWCGPGPSHYPWMRCDAQKLIEYSPRGVSCIRLRALAFKPVAARDMELGINIRGINKHVGVDGKH